MIFDKEKTFEDAVVAELCNHGWNSNILEYPTEETLIDNWAKILFENNKSKDRLNDCPLTSGEMQDILSQLKALGSPMKINSFINGGSLTIKRDNPDDKLHFGKEVSLKIYDRNEIAGGDSRYQIARQPMFKVSQEILPKRRGDLMLLINGMPVFHLELKRSNVSVSEAYYQIEKYSFENVFSGIFSLVQIFVAMTPEETVYFANPGTKGTFNKDFYFHWADFNNDPINNWKDLIGWRSFLSIPEAHQLIGFYTISDNTDATLKVMRSYQINAAKQISDKVAKSKWTKDDSLGGYIWHTTGSGKTLTSFKSAQLIANSKNADKVVFLMDRVELGTQSLGDYRAFSEDDEFIQDTKNTRALLAALKSDNVSDTLIVTSIQKMSNIVLEDDKSNFADIEKIRNKRVVFIIDECHRSTFGEMLSNIKITFPTAMFFGFTGTPIHDENKKKMNTTSDVFGDELHRYSIADGIADKNVLGFDVTSMSSNTETYREQVALKQANAKDLAEVMSNPNKQKIYYDFMDEKKYPMAGYHNESGKYVKGIEDYYPKSQYVSNVAYQESVVENVLNDFDRLSKNRKFHAIFATNSIKEAIEYYDMFKEKTKMKSYNITALFDPGIDNNEFSITKEKGLINIIKDYNKMFDGNYTIPTYPSMKKDISLRLAHKKPYVWLGGEGHKDQQIDILIVVDQMLTGFDSKWVNTLYLDKKLKHESIIQAFSRTNRVFDNHEKPFGIVRYYRYPFTMEKNINKALKLYSGDKPYGIFVEKLDANLKKINAYFSKIVELFSEYYIEDFSELPKDRFALAKFAKDFNCMYDYIEAATIQGFNWDQKIYEFTNKDDIEVLIDYETYVVLLQRYKELPKGSGDGSSDDVPLEVDSYITKIESERIDSDYMNARFVKFKKAVYDKNHEEIDKLLQLLHKSFASLPKEDQEYANQLLHLIQSGDVDGEAYNTIYDYISEKKVFEFQKKIDYYVANFGVDKELLTEMCNSNLNEGNYNEFGRFTDLKDSVNWESVKKYYELKDNKIYKILEVKMKFTNELRDFIINI